MNAFHCQYQQGADGTVFREVVGHFLSGVTVVTTDDGSRYGVTASAVSSLSLDPPMVLVCLNQKLATVDAIRRAGHFAVNILGSQHAALAAQFAVPHPDKFRDVDVQYGASGSPLIVEALAQIECAVAEVVPAATHTIVLGRVVTARARPGDPLAYFRGQFGQFVNA
ncbi:flavin reductase family protein [Alloalcanivorax gelatiniphagus]